MKNIPQDVKREAQEAHDNVVMSHCQRAAISELATLGMDVVGFHHMDRECPLEDFGEIYLTHRCKPSNENYIEQLVEEAKQAFQARY